MMHILVKCNSVQLHFVQVFNVLRSTLNSSCSCDVDHRNILPRFSSRKPESTLVALPWNLAQSLLGFILHIYNHNKTLIAAAVNWKQRREATRRIHNRNLSDAFARQEIQILRLRCTHHQNCTCVYLSWRIKLKTASKMTLRDPEAKRTFINSFHWSVTIREYW